MEDFVQLKKDNILRLGIKDAEGNDTGECLIFDLEDIELPLKYQDLLEQEKKNRQFLKTQFAVIDKKQDVKGKKLFSKNEEDKIKVLKDFFVKEKEIYNGFLGDKGVEKLLNGRNLTWTCLQEIDEIMTEQIVPYLDLSMKNITKKVKEIYGKEKIDKEVLK